jgi:hypothetical protein
LLENFDGFYFDFQRATVLYAGIIGLWQIASIKDWPGREQAIFSQSAEML